MPQVVKVGGSAGTFRSDYLYEGDVIVLHHPVRIPPHAAGPATFCQETFRRPFHVRVDGFARLGSSVIPPRFLGARCFFRRAASL